jgi:hypothetical protein
MYVLFVAFVPFVINLAYGGVVRVSGLLVAGASAFHVTSLTLGAGQVTGDAGGAFIRVGIREHPGSRFGRATLWPRTEERNYSGI